MNLEELAAFAKRYAEARELRIATGMWLRATEVRIRDRDQLAVLAEFVEKASSPSSCPDCGSSDLTSVPVYEDEDVPAGTLRFVLEDGSTKDFRLA